MVSLPGLTPHNETVSRSQRRFSSIEPLDRLQATLPTAHPQTPALNFRSVPATSSERCRASGAAASRDQDAYLPEKIAAEEDKGHGMPQAYAEETVLYLAYGSNMAAQTFLGMRGIKPISKIPVLVPELRLTFDLPGIPYAEPCFAGTEFRDPDSIPEEDSESDFDASDEERLLTESEYLSEKVPLVQTTELGESRALRWNKPLIGVVYEVTLVDYAKIIATEGGGRGYRDVVVDCFPFAEDYTPTKPIPSRPSTQVFKAHTLLSPAADEARRITQKAKRGESASCSSCSSIFGKIGVHMRPDPEYAQPSARYLGLLISGATEHDLPISYREYLSQIHTYKITSIRQTIGKFSFMAVWAPPVLSTLVLSRKFAGPDGRSPPWVVSIADVVVAAMWTSYDYFYRWVFGDGERTIGDHPSV